MKLLIAGGGTGGHLFPGIAVAEEFLSRDQANEVLFVGTERGIEARVVPAAGYGLELISAAGIRGKGSLSKFRGGAQMLYGYAQSRTILKRFQPDLVLGVGGYASLPMVLAAGGMQVPRFIHEQNAIPGLTNRLLARTVRQVFITMEESRKYFPEGKCLLTGNPLRRQILDMVETITNDAVNRSPADTPFRLLVFGGSQGAHAINMAIKGALPYLTKHLPNLEIRHQTGEQDRAELEQAYHDAGVSAQVSAFITDMGDAYRFADLIICRAGATTIAEVSAAGKACLFIPFPHAVDDHQRKNAEALLKQSACLMLVEPELTKDRLPRLICELVGNRESLYQMGDRARSLARLDAARIIVDEMLTSL